MRNLKKILALVLALVMSMSLLATANAFNDDAEIDPTYDEAVTVLANLGVFQGYNNGETFVPKGSITRAEVAAILYRIATGDVDNTQVSLYADYNTFNDVKSTSWYAGYVNYCANAEYIKGYDDKTFGPNDPVTGYQALAMILRAVGYDVNDEFTGTSWQVKVASTANQLGITRNITAGTLGTAATREVVAEILFRTIAEAYIVEYTTAFGYQPVYLPTSSNNNGSAGNLSGNIARATLGFRTFGLELTEGEISAVGRTAGTTTLIQDSVAANGTALLNSVTVTGTSTPWTDIGYAAYVYTVPAAGVKTREAVSDVVITGESLGVTTAGTSAWSNLYTNSVGNSDFIAERADSNSNEEFHVYYNGVLAWSSSVPGGWTSNAAAVTGAQKWINSPATAIDRGVKVDFIDNDNGGRAEVVAITEYTVAQVQAVTTDTTTTGTNGSYETRVYVNNGIVAPFAITGSTLVTNDDLAVGDWATYVLYNGDYYVTEAPATSAKYTARVISATADTVYTIGGNNYFVSDLEYVTGANTANRLFASAYLNDPTNQSKDVTIYTDPYGYIVMAQATAATNSYLYVISNAATNPNTGLTEAVVALSDGTISTVQISRGTITNANNPYIYAANTLVGMWTYSVDTAGTYSLASRQSEMTAATYTTKTATISGIVSGIASSRKVDLATVIVDLRDYKVGSTSVPVYTGYNEIPTVQNTVVWVNVGNNNTAVAVGFLLQNSNTVKQDFIVYQTTEYQEIISGITNHTISYTMDVLVGDTVSEDYALTIEQFNDIQTYKTGIYSFISNDGGKTFTLVEYTSFDEVWDTATWGTGVITWNGKNYTYDSQKLVVVDVANRRVTNGLSLAWGTTSHAYIANAGTASQIVYAILGTEAPTTTQVINGVTVTVTHPDQPKDDATYTYDVATGYITMNRNQIVKDATYTVNNVMTYKVGATAEVSAVGPWVAVTDPTGANAPFYAKVENGKASFKMPAYNVVTVDGFYAYKVDTTEKYVSRTELGFNSNPAHVGMDDLDFTGATGKYYRVFADSYGANPDATSIVAAANLSTTASDVVNYYEVITTGLYKVTVGAAGGTGKNTADKDVYDSTGALVKAGTVLTNGDDYYAFAGTTFAKVRDGHDNEYYTVPANASDYTF